MKKLVLIDGHALVHRAFHALPPTLNSPKGVPTNAVFGFTSVLLKMIKDLKPDYIAAAFDLAAPTFRHEEFAEYKAHRVKAPDELYVQIPLVKEMLTAFGVPIYEKAGFEADDLIGSLAEKSKKDKSIQTIIMTGDLDTLQLIDNKRVVVFTLRKGVTDTVIYDEDEVFKRYGLKPEQLNDFKGLKGDPSDNIPGVPGVGEKTSSELIKEFENLENLYQFLENQKSEIKNQNDKEKIKNFKKPLTTKLVEKLLENKDMAFFSKKLATIVRDVDVDFSLDKSDWLKNLKKEEVDKQLKELGFYSLTKRFDELDIQGLNIRQKALLEPTQTRLCTGPSPRPKELNLIWNDNGKVFGHDLKLFSKKYITEKGREPELGFDIKIAAYLLRSDRKNYDPEVLYREEFGREIADDPNAMLSLERAFGKRLKDQNLLMVFEEIEMPLINVLAEMELRGVLIDSEAIAKLSKLVTSEIIKLEKDIYKQAGAEFNINSPKQLKEILFEKLQIKGKVRKTSKGALSTAAGELEKLVDEHPIIEKILRYREIQKLKTTYTDPFPALISKTSGRLHTTFNQTGTTTGRLASQDPNLQNIPVKTELGQEFRKAFVASPGFKLASFDYSQIELRIAAHISQDEKMTTAFKRGEDIHARTASEIFGVKPEMVDKNMRRDAKVLNFGILYGMGILGFQRASGVSRDKAREFIDRYMREFSGIAKYMNEMKIKARKEGYVSTIFGRRRWFPEIKSSMPQVISQAERMAINMPIQGTAADLMKLAMIKIFEHLHNSDSRDNAFLLLQVHDELLFEIKDHLVDKISTSIKEIMENIWELHVPLIVDVKLGLNWSEMEKIK
ncbi:MAG: DNA polymerase I [Candidatus Yanofskybacteria bacterium]|nr:DNA polymerase I [Candidatus Yanofskybacteria bacterium]